VRRVVVRDEDGKRITFLTNNTSLAPQTISELYRLRWQVELFFKWIKQHLRIKAFFGISENAVEDANLDRSSHLRVDRHCQETRAACRHSLYEL